MKLRKLFLIICTLCFGLALVLGVAACGEDEIDPSIVRVIGISLNKSELELEVGDTETLTINFTPTNATDKSATWESSNPSSVTVVDGVVTAKATGAADITATASGKSATCHVTVKQSDEEKVAVKSITLNKTSLELEEGETFDLVATVLPADATNRTVSWTSDSGCVTVSDKGKVTAVKAGTATITARAERKDATCVVTVSPKILIDSITIIEQSIVLTEGDTKTLTVKILPEDLDATIKWSTSNSAVATVENGTVTAVAPGIADITAKVGDKSSTCRVSVKGKPVAVTSVTLNPTTASITVGATAVLTATVAPENATDKNVTWKSLDESVATVTGGAVYAKKVGKTTITATAGGKSATCVVTVTAPIAVTSVTLNKTTLTLTIGGSDTLIATVLPNDATNKAVTWTSSDTAIATVTDGAVYAKSAGTATITATADGKSATCTVTVEAGTAPTVPVSSVSLNKTTMSLTVGGTDTLIATVLPENATSKAVSWSSSNTSVATVSSGTVTARAKGEATITATVGGKSATCKVTVTEARVEVTSITLDVNADELEIGETLQLHASINPSNATDNDITWTSSNESVATVVDGLITAKAAGNATITASIGNISAVCEITVVANGSGDNGPSLPDDSILSYAYAGEETAAFEWDDSKASSAKVEYKLSTSSSYISIDKQLIRQITTTTARADILGLKGGEKYDFRITAGDGTIETVKKVAIASLDRSGYAHSNTTVGVGAYNNDGTLKSNAIVIYVTEENKNNVDGNGNSIAQYLTKSANNSKPIVIRIIGTVGSATWKTLEYNEEGHEGDDITPDDVVGRNGKKLVDLKDDAKKLTQEALISGGYNELNLFPEKYNGKQCDPIAGLNSKASYNSSKNEMDSCWNDCSVSYVKNLTVEGVGEDAEIFQWGFTFKQCNSIEVRNIRFFDYTEDACSFEGNEASETADGFSYKNFWVHHNIFDLGMNYWDLCNEQDKHDGDGATDFKKISYVTIAYNRYNDTHKTGLVGGDDSHLQACFTFHHNYYNGCDQRMPLGRQANMHMYNNYYSSSGLYSISLRASAYAFVENCTFTSRDKNTRPIELVSGSKGKPAAKVIDCSFDSNKIVNGVGDAYLYQGSDRSKTVSGDNKYGLNFDLNMPYTIQEGTKLATSKVATVIPKLAGTQKRNSNIFVGDGDNNNDDDDPPVTDPTPKTNVNFKVSDAVSSGKFTTVDNNTRQNFDNLSLVDGSISIYATGEVVKVTEHSKTIDNVAFTHRVVLKNKGNYFAITTAGACTIKVYVANSSTTDETVRLLGLYTDARGETLVSGTDTTGLGKNTAQVVQYTVSAKGTYYLESITNELSIYGIDIIYS